MANKEFDVLSTVLHRFAEQGSTPSQPAPGFAGIWFGTDGQLRSIDDGGIASGPFVTLDPASDVRNVIEPAADFIPLTVRGSAAAQTKDIFVAEEGSADTEVLSISGTGAVVFQNFTDSTIGFQVFDKNGGTPILNIDTTNERVGIGTNAPSVAFDVVGSVAIQPPTDLVSLTVRGFAGANSANLFEAHEGLTNATVFKIEDDGRVVIQPNVNNTNAFIVKNVAFGSILHVDTNSGQVGVNINPSYPFTVGAGDAVFNQFNAAGNININGVPVSANYDLALSGDGVLAQKEATTPSPDAGYGKTYWKNDNQFYGQDGAGEEHLIHGDSFGNIWFHGSSTAVTIGAADTFVVIDTFAVVGPQDDMGNTIGNISTNTLTIAAGAGGDYDVKFGASMSVAGGADKEMVIGPGITLNTPKDITNVTDDLVTPIVITSVAHGFENGDMVQIVDVLVNTAANGSFMVGNKADDTFEIVALDGAATTGNGDYDEGTPTGDITIWYPGSLVTHREVSGSDIGVIAHESPITLVGGDVIKCYVANLDDTNNLSVFQISMTVKRFAAE